MSMPVPARRLSPSAQARPDAPGSSPGLPALLARATLTGAALLPCLAAQVHVPGDFSTLQGALDAVPDGSTIIVHGGIHEAILIEHPVTIVGDPVATIRTACCVPADDIELPAIRLDGPGHGTVVLEHLRTEGSVQDGFESEGGAGIAGGGFDELVILRATIAGSDGVTAFGGAQIPGGPGIDVHVPYLLLSDSSVRGGVSSYPDFPGSQLIGTPGLRAPGSSVALLDSSVTGGAVDDTLFSPWAPCPSGCEAIMGGTGGIGLVAGTLFIAGSTVEGGKGMSASCFTPTGPMLVCTKPDGDGMLVASVQRLPGELSLSGPLPLGGMCDLTWSANRGPALLLAGLGVQSPEPVPGKGLLFLDAFVAEIVVVATGSPVTESFRIPDDTSLAGLVLTAQLYDPAAGLSRPVVAPLLP